MFETQLIKKRKVATLSALFLCLLLIQFSCKEKGELQPSFVEGDLRAVFTDTVTVNALTVLEDSLNTTFSTRHLLGVYNDPVFGMSRASIYTQFILSTASLEFPSNNTLDSVVLYMEYDGDYGNANDPLEIQVYEVDEDFVEGETYYNFSTLQTKPELLGSASYTDQTFLTQLADTSIENTVLRIKLDNTLMVSASSVKEAMGITLHLFKILKDCTSLRIPITIQHHKKAALPITHFLMMERAWYCTIISQVKTAVNCLLNTNFARTVRL